MSSFLLNFIHNSEKIIVHFFPKANHMLSNAYDTVDFVTYDSTICIEQLNKLNGYIHSFTERIRFTPVLYSLMIL